jgi:hypothetical protein
MEFYLQEIEMKSSKILIHALHALQYALLTLESWLPIGVGTEKCQ